MALKYPQSSDRRTFLRTFSAALLAGTTVSGLAGPARALSGPERLVVKIANQVIALANSGVHGLSLHARFVRLLTTHANMNAVALFALGRYRRKLPPHLKARYFKAVKAYVAGLFVYYVNDFKGGGLSINRSYKSGRSLIIDSRISSSASTQPIKWRVFTSGSRHRVTDVNIRGVWMSITMRNKFIRILKRSKGDFNELMSFLNEYKNYVK